MEALRLLRAPEDDARMLGTYWMAVGLAEGGAWDEAQAHFAALDRADGWEAWGSLELARQWSFRDPLVGAVLFERYQADHPDPLFDSVISRSIARDLLSAGHIREAEDHLSDPGYAPFRERLHRARWRRPGVGALLSAILPGAGQTYAGRPGEGLSALLVNGLFISGFVWAIREEQYAAAGLIGLFGIGFYSGNIYGGADAALRWNRRQRDGLIGDFDRLYPIEWPRPCTD